MSLKDKGVMFFNTDTLQIFIKKANFSVEKLLVCLHYQLHRFASYTHESVKSFSSQKNCILKSMLIEHIY